MEFKGTKGKWKWDYYEDGNYASLYVLGKGDILNIQPIKENTLYDINLASKAPEMLEMLQWFVYNFEGVFHEGTETDNKIKESKQLIKQATEL